MKSAVLHEDGRYQTCAMLASDAVVAVPRLALQWVAVDFCLGMGRRHVSTNHARSAGSERRRLTSRPHVSVVYVCGGAGSL